MITILKILLISMIYLVLSALASDILPYSSDYKDLLMSASRLVSSLLTAWLIGVWNAVLIYLGVRYSECSRIKAWFFLSAYLFLLQFFMTQIETWFFIDSFTALNRIDIMLIMAGQLASILVSVLAGVVLFRRSPDTAHAKTSIRYFVPKLFLIGLLYMSIYFLFGYFVAWQFEAIRMFYTGSPEKASFSQVMLGNFNQTPWIFPFQFIRGLFFGLINYLLFKLLASNRKVYVVASVFSNISLGLMLLIPNPLFTDAARMAHFYEVTSSMVVFSLLMCGIYLLFNTGRDLKLHPANVKLLKKQGKQNNFLNLL